MDILCVIRRYVHTWSYIILKPMILPGTTVTVIDKTSIYWGYVGFVQRISGNDAAVLFDNYSPWEKMITFPIKSLKEGGIGPK